MNDDHPAASAESPVSNENTLTANALLSERSMQCAVGAPAKAGTVLTVERRSGLSDLEIASVVLAHAVQYLSSEQRAGRCTSARGNRQAITLLCECAEKLTLLEHREPAREALNTWLAGARQS